MQGAAEHRRLTRRKLRLLGYRCADCGKLYPWWKIYSCEACSGRNMIPEELSGEAKLANYTVVYYPPPEFRGMEPYIIGQFEMNEGVKIPAPLVEITQDKVTVGQACVASLRRIKRGLDGEIYYNYKFKLVERIDRDLKT